MRFSARAFHVAAGAAGDVIGGAMIARIWRGAVRIEDADAYSTYMQGTGIPAYARTPGNHVIARNS